MKKIMKIFITIFSLMMVWTNMTFAAPADDFVITVKTDNSGSSTNTQFEIPTNPSETYNYNVDCDNDGIDDATGQTGNYICNYPTSGTYTVRIKDNTGTGDGFPAIYFNNNNDNSKLLTIEQWGTGHWATFENAFYGCNNMIGTGTSDVPDLTNVINMSSAFRDSAFNQADISMWNVSGVQNMREMFYGAASFNQNINSWDVSNVEYMDYMFAEATSFDQNINSWDVSNVEYMNYMFEGAISFNQNISSWDVSKVRYMQWMFSDARSFDQNINSWDVSTVEYMQGMFNDARSFDQNINSWDVSNVRYMQDMFHGAISFNQNISSWDVSSVMYMNYMFDNATLFNQNISSWDVSSVMYMNYMFNNATLFNQNISSWNVSNVTYMNEMFQDANLFNQDLSLWDVSSVVAMDHMFDGTSLSTENYDSILSGWDALSLQSGVEFGAANTNYCVGETARDHMISSDSWNIIDAGKHCNTAPIITSNGGGDTASISIDENTTAVTTVTATDVDTGDSLFYSISGGPDQALFTIDSLTGVLSFISAPDYENPTDSDSNNNYVVQVRVTDNGSPNMFDTQTITVNVLDVNEYELSITKTQDASEPSTNAVFTISLNQTNTSGVPITGDITYTGTATEGIDYNTCACITSFSIPNNATQTTVTLVTLDDLVAEPREEITATISNPSTGTIVTEYDTAYLFDNDGANNYELSIEKLQDASEPSTNAEFIITLNQTNTTGSSIMGYLAYTGTATEGVDYQTGPVSFAILDGQTSTNISLTTIDDLITEPIETITVTILDPSTGTILVNQASADLLDNDNYEEEDGGSGGGRSFPKHNAEISGNVWNDKDQDKTIDTDEDKVSNIIIKLYKNNKLYKTEKTNSKGKYEFKKLKSGNYKVVIKTPEEYKNSTETEKEFELSRKDKKRNVNFGIYKETKKTEEPETPEEPTKPEKKQYNNKCNYFTEWMHLGDQDGKLSYYTQESGKREIITEVKKLQNWLNTYYGTKLEVNGVYNKKTKDAVRYYQGLPINYDFIIKPWVPPLSDTTTGNWYKTSRYFGNWLMGNQESGVYLEDNGKYYDPFNVLDEVQTLNNKKVTKCKKQNSNNETSNGIQNTQELIKELKRKIFELKKRIAEILNERKNQP